MSDKNSPSWQDADNIKAIKQETIMNDVTGGTLNIQSKSTTYLPKYEMESDTDYQSRLKNSELLPTTAESIKAVTGKLLSKPTQLNDIDTENNFFIENIDGTGTSFSSFEHQAIHDTEKYGVTFNLVDFASLGERTRQQEKTDDVKPYFKTIQASQVLNKRTSLINGKIVLTQVTIKESITKDDGEFGTESVDQYRVYRLEGGVVTVTLWEDGKDGEKIIEAERPLDMNGLAMIPLIPIYSGEHGYMTGVSPFAEMAQLNLSVYRMNSGLKRTIYNVGDPTHVIKGQTPTDDNGQPLPIVVGSSNMLNIDSDGEYSIVGMSPESIQPTKDEIETMKQDMAKIAVSITATDTQKTAKEVGIDNANQTSKLMQTAISAENCWNVSKEIYYAFLGVPNEGEIVVNKDFSGTKLTPEEVKVLQTDLQLDNITKETYLKEMQKGEWYTTIDDVEAEALQAENEAANSLKGVVNV
jgi:hypothetical protein